MRLFHYTNRYHLQAILNACYLDVTESNLELRRTHAGPDVVWLTNKSDLYKRGAPWSGRGSIPVDKLEVRFTVRVDDAVPWERWQRKHKMKRQWYVHFVKAGGDPSTWFVVEHRIPREQWLEVRLMPQDVALDFMSYDAARQSVPVLQE